MSSSPIYDPHRKVYSTGDSQYSIVDLLSSAFDPDYMRNGMPRISDFHFKVGEPVRFRMDQELYSVPGGELLSPELAEALIYPMLSEVDWKQMRDDPMADVDSSFPLTIEDQAYNFRINAFHENDGLAAVIRLLPPKIPDLQECGFPNDQVWKHICGIHQGLVIVSGVTGSGKSTTIASLLDTINQSSARRIITLEDPVEYLFKSKRSLISQRELGRHVSNFAQGLRSALREDPDIIFVGEIRDLETASLALAAAETGHLVFAPLHTRDAIGALTRLIDMFPAERERELSTQLSFSLAYVLSQKLIPRADGKGRTVAMEVLRNTPQMGNFLRSRKLHQIYSAMETGGEYGMITMERRLLQLHEDGAISRDNAIFYANRDDIIGRLP
ncbi:PilT/PilU family type 4a pilus ATPase [Ruficoccus sp. ZRK36]|uniref:type IV pilus twitching motility protein PilT n=1 Tax=Ruficoccus sp. ZRK36 TaxID=2866311 RepID=UPI001C72EE4B|nr:PilT/PilU family type 4a pilus ATPase [Ruficoccus sp. ZRK36]QYY36958.1 PilT/PilU family type 4a pilus ATPase [Ruficoccus sp. ZRK36]